MLQVDYNVGYSLAVLLLIAGAAWNVSLHRWTQDGRPSVGGRACSVASATEQCARSSSHGLVFFVRGNDKTRQVLWDRVANRWPRRRNLPLS